MKFSKTTGLLALGLAGRAAADAPADAGVYTVTGAVNGFPSNEKSDFPAIPTSTTTVTATTTVTNVSTTTVTATTIKTETLTKEATTVYRSTVYVAPSVCTSTVVNVDGQGHPWPPPGPAPAGATGSAPAGDWSPPAPAAPTGTAPTASWQSDAPVDPAHSTGAPAVWPAGGTTTINVDWANTATPSGSKTTATGVVDPSMPEDGSWIDWANDVTTIGQDGDVWSWTVDVPTATFTGAAPTYSGAWPGGDGNDGGDGDSGSNGSDGGDGGKGGSGNGSFPVPGSPASNVTKPILPLPEGYCNTAADRSKWCGGQSIKTDITTAGYKTGKTCSYDFTVTNTTMDYDGSGAKLALAINGQVPGPVIECNWGDILQVTVHNKMQDNSTTIHWHGLYSYLRS